MKKWMLAGALVVVLGSGTLFPFEKIEPGNMCIVETLLVEADEDGITLLTRDCWGKGGSMEEAKAEMESRAPGRLFLRQVKRVVFCKSAQDQIDMMDIPKEIPVGAFLYTGPGSGETLLKELDGIEARLEERELEGRSLITLGNVQDEILEGNHYETR